MNHLKALGKELQVSRERVGLTQIGVAKKLGYRTAQFISNWERGLSYPPIEVIPTIAKLYKMDDKVIRDHIYSSLTADLKKHIYKK